VAPSDLSSQAPRNQARCERGDTAASRVRVRYDKTGKLRFISAIDLGRIWERSLRRSRLPIAYSEGFSPHPKVSFTDALPLGYASTGEYAELTFAGPIPLQPAIIALNAAFPDGIAVRAAVAVGDGDPKLAKWLLASCWDMHYPPGTVLEAAVTAVEQAAALPVLRERKGEPVTVDLRPAIHQICADRACVRVTLHHLQVPVRPTEVDLALRSTDPALPSPALVVRVAQGRPVAEGLVEALSGELIEPLHPTDMRLPT
jgi:radical SAM-linked protein